MKVLVTGATGFLGKYIIEELVSAGYQLVAFGRNETIGRSLVSPQVTFVKGDLANLENVRKAAQGVEMIVHAGALSDVWGPWQQFYESNVLGTQNILTVCDEFEIKRLVHISSPSIYAKASHQFNVTEDGAPLENNLNYYIKSKLMAEHLVTQSTVPYVILRPRGLFGVGDVSIVPRLLRTNDTIGIPLLNGGQQLVDMTCVENVAYAIRLCLEHDKALGQIYNLTNDEPMPFKDLLDLFFKASGNRPHYRKLPAKPLEVLVSLIESIFLKCRFKKEPPLTRYTFYLLAYSQTLSIAKIKRELGYHPKLTIEEGVQKYVDYHRKH
ncbi:NAD-dependent epimerase/dehydratase family protein [Streptococcus hillyeri]|uniref:NAD(P)-dependent oxidoreductase n=1 Tax=Streptococcus hillyeri TaxID=2282420 RepID=A0A3L9DZY2_9STRE|nr:NAD(P)-dependent oxidoreductase [Streptococcus hillyeri]RLY05397.1 NAD(P)-dependent oxidoreductase [Streptococcus hillyeri]